MPDSTNTPEVSSVQADGAMPPAETLGDSGRKALDAERKARRDAERELSELRTRLGEIEAAELRRDVAASKNLTAAQAARLVGATREELEADADSLVEAFSPHGGAMPPSRKPIADLRGGSNPEESVPDFGKLADEIVGRGM